MDCNFNMGGGVMEALDLAVKILDEARTQIQANMAVHYRTSKGERWVNARGKSSQAFQVTTEGNHARLIYQGDDVAPLESIQYGSQRVPSYQEAANWIEAKRNSGAERLPSPDQVMKAIERKGTERWSEPQEWIINPVVENAVSEILEKVGAAYINDLKAYF